MCATAGIGGQFAKPHHAQTLSEDHLTREVLRLPCLHLAQQRAGVGYHGVVPAGESDPPLARPVVRFHRLPAKLFARQAKQVAGGMQAGMQVSRGGIYSHLHFTEGKRLRQNMQHAVAAHDNRLNGLTSYPAAIRRLTAPLRVKQRPIQFDGVAAIRFRR